jgi:tetratricopeptide (TPR) repeat protein
VDNSNNTDYEKKNKSDFDVNPLSLSYYPKIEMIVKKAIDENFNVDTRSIEKLISKYIPKSLAEKYSLMDREDKARIYKNFGTQFNIIAKDCVYPLDVENLAKAYFNHSSKTNSNEPKESLNPFEHFDMYSKANNYCEEGAKLAEQCIESSDPIDTNIKFVEIYSYLAIYNYNENNYEKSIQMYKKVQDYSDSNSYEYQDSKINISYIYYILGEYEKGLVTINEVKDSNIVFPPNFREELKEKTLYFWRTKIKKLKEDFKIAIACGTRKEQEDDSFFMDNMRYEYRDYLDKYPEDVLIEAYKHFLKAEKMIDEGKRLESIEEYEIVKKLVPEKTRSINAHLCMLINRNTVNEDNKEYYYNIKLNLLNERLEIALKSNNQGDLCNVYNELGCFYGELNDNLKRLQYFKKAVGIAGLTSIYGTNLAICYKDLGLYDEAIKIYKIIKSTSPSFAEEYDMNLDYEISRLNDMKLGKITGKTDENQEQKNTENKLALEHSQKGDEYFNKGDYEKAFIEYNAACEIDKNEIQYLIKMIMLKEMYECEYLYEVETISKALKECERLDKIEYLPFLFTIMGDYVTYEGSGKIKQAEKFYELAIDLLNLVPNDEKFAAPYYKLARLKEHNKKYYEALTLYQFISFIDDSYNTDIDINRVKLLYENNGTSNSKEVNNLIIEMEYCLKAGSYFEVLQRGKKALEYEPDNVKVHYLICKAFEKNKLILNKSLYYEFKWFAKEGMKANNIDHYKIDENERTENYFRWFLGLCCKFENKKEQAQYYFDYIVDLDDVRNKKLTKKAANELFFMYHGKILYKEDLD